MEGLTINGARATAEELRTLEFGFDGALILLKEGERVQRKGWNGKGMWIQMQSPSAGSKMTLPYIYMKTVTDDLVPWLASQTDLLAEDWVLL